MNGAVSTPAEELPTLEEMALLREKINELTGGLEKLQECYQRLQALDEKPEIEGGTNNG